MRLSVFGLGYVGCVTAASLAKAGHEVIGADVNAEKVAMVNGARPPVVEPGLAELLAEVVGEGRLRATTSSDEAVADSDVSLICVGTPSRATGALDVEAIARTGHSIGKALRKRAEPYTVVLRSTVLPGTTEQCLVPALLAGSGGREAVRVAMNPEFMREGSSLADFARPPFTVFGGHLSPVPARREPPTSRSHCSKRSCRPTRSRSVAPRRPCWPRDCGAWVSWACPSRMAPTISAKVRWSRWSRPSSERGATSGSWIAPSRSRAWSEPTVGTSKRRSPTSRR